LHYITLVGSYPGTASERCPISLTPALQLSVVNNDTGYSYWTNTTFKYPLLFSAGCCLAGNVAYVAAYDTRAVSLLYAARLLTGLGTRCAVQGWV